MALGLVAVASVVGGAALGLKALKRGSLSDQSENTVGAVRAVLRGENPYSLRLDPDTEKIQASVGDVDPKWLGYKYGPATIAVFAPLAGGLGEIGIVLTDALSMALIALALALIVHRRAGTWSTAIAFAALPFAARYMASVTRYGETDPPAVAIALFGLWAVEAGHLGAAGALIAASCAAKLFPGAIYAVVLWPLFRRTQYAVGFCLAGLALSLPALVADPSALVRSLLIFPFTRAPDSTGLPYFLPESVRWLLPLLGTATLAFAAIAHRTPQTLVRRLVWAHIAVLAVGNYFHNNYLVWLYPLLGLVAAELFAAKPEAEELKTSR